MSVADSGETQEPYGAIVTMAAIVPVPHGSARAGARGGPDSPALARFPGG
jgi:hypothetical protein